VTDARIMAVVLIALAVISFIRGARGRFKPGFGVSHLNDVPLKAKEQRAYLALGAVLTTIGFWMLLR